MRKFSMLFFVVFSLMLGGASVYAADCTKTTPGDRVGDWFGTFGKQGAEKDRILAQRKMDRMVACAQRQAGKAIKDARKAGDDMRKNLGF